MTIDHRGRLVVPAGMRAALGLESRDQVHLRLDGKRLVVERQADAGEQLRGFAADVPATRCLVDELLAERRIAPAD